MDRLYEVRESQPIFSTYLEQGVMAGLLRCARQVESVDDDELASAITADHKDCDRIDAALLQPALPPGVENIQQTPRRPGAPATLAV